MQEIKKKMKTLQEYETASQSRCEHCGNILGDIEHYPHSGGWVVKGFQEKQWLYRTCLKCGYQWALWKIGVPRD